MAGVHHAGERSWAKAAFNARTGRERVRAYATAIRRVMRSAGPAFRVAAQAAATDVDAAALWAAGQQRRLEDSTAFVAALHDAHLLRRRASQRQSVATVWLITAPQTFTQVTDGLGWTLDRDERWINHSLADALPDPAARGRGADCFPRSHGVAGTTPGSPQGEEVPARHT